MFHLDYLKEGRDDSDAFLKKASGRYYTGELVGRQLAHSVAVAYGQSHPNALSISVIDPFAGDGRLIEWIIEAWVGGGFPEVSWNVAIWDFDDVGFKTARERLKHVAARTGVRLKQTFKVVDSFTEALKAIERFDVVLTNPPWEQLKPDRRELQGLTTVRKGKYIACMRAYDQWLAQHYPHSQPRRKFAGWGTNLSRVGLEASLSLVRKGGVVGAVLPASILADDQTVSLRKQLLTKHTLLSVTYYSAEAKLYGAADVASITAAIRVGGKPATSLAIAAHHKGSGQLEEATISLDLNALRKVDFVVPISFGAKSLAILNSLAQRFPTWLELESGAADSMWAGRELDETGIARWLKPDSARLSLFIKGRMIGRYTIAEVPSQSVVRPDWKPPVSVRHLRIAWRDVSRPNQKRRIIATVIEPGWVAGNSLGVAYFRDGAETPLLAMLGVMNSLSFEFQLRAHLATGHISLSSLRKVAVPSLTNLRQEDRLAALVRNAISVSDIAAPAIDAYVARNIYGLNEAEYEIILEGFDKLSRSERFACMESYRLLACDAKVHPKVSSLSLVKSRKVSCLA